MRTLIWAVLVLLPWMYGCSQGDSSNSEAPGPEGASAKAETTEMAQTPESEKPNTTSKLLFEDREDISLRPYSGSVVAWELGRRPLPQVGLVLKPARIAAGVVLLVAYAAVPFGWMTAVEGSGNYSVDILRRPEHRPGQPLGLDRNRFLHEADGDYLRLWSGERVRVVGLTLDHDATVSIRGSFVDRSTVRIHALHEHRGLSRDLWTYLALVLFLVLCARPLIRKAKT